MNALGAVVRKTLTDLDLGLKGALSMSNQSRPQDNAPNSTHGDRLDRRGSLPWGGGGQGSILPWKIISPRTCNGSAQKIVRFTGSCKPSRMIHQGAVKPKNAPLLIR